MCASLSAAGHTEADIAWVGPIGFYAKAGAVVSRVFRNAKLTALIVLGSETVAIRSFFCRERVGTAQYSVISRTCSWSSLYSGEFVSGMSCMSLPMLPVTFMRPCMNAAFASSSPFWTFTESS